MEVAAIFEVVLDLEWVDSVFTYKTWDSAQLAW